MPSFVTKNIFERELSNMLGGTYPSNFAANYPTRFNALSELRSRIGRAIYAGRVPRDNEHHTFITMERLTTDREYWLRGEDTLAEAIITIDIYSRAPNAPMEVLELGELLRLGLTSYKGWIGSMFVQSSTIISDNSTPAISPRDASDRWTYGYATTFNFQYEQIIPERS